MKFETREDYIKWAVIMLMTNMDFKTDTGALNAAQALAQQAANLFFDEPRAPRQGTQQAGSDPYRDPPAIKTPPQVAQSGPSVPGQRDNPHG